MNTILKKYFGYDSFRDKQEVVIKSVLDKQDTLAIMPTGGGKSLCYQLPALLFKGLTIVVSPLIALMQDQVDALQKSDIPAVFLNSSLDWDTYCSNMNSVRAGQTKLLYCAPETLLTDRVQRLLTGLQVDCVTIDEAHCISQWGHDFRPEYREIFRLRSFFPNASFLALTATATAHVREDIKKSLALQNPAEFISSFNRENIFLQVVPKWTAKQGGAARQVCALLTERRDQSGIIYCFSRKQTEVLTKALCAKGLSAAHYHGGLSDAVRLKHQHDFTTGRIRIIVATLAFGMGIDKGDVRFVIHVNLPKSLEQYYQEIGRAGRDGSPADAILLYSYADTQKIRYFIDEKSGTNKIAAEEQLHAMTAYAYAKTCRRKNLLAYFGENYNASTDNQYKCCDICAADPIASVDVTIAVQKLLSCVIRSGERYGAAYIADILLGSRNKRVRDNNHTRLSTWGIGKEYRKTEWIELARLLTDAGFLHKTQKYGVLSVSRNGIELLKEREKIELPFMPERR